MDNQSGGKCVTLPRDGTVPDIEARGVQVSEVTYFSLSPNHLDMRSDEDTEKNVELLASVATALAR